MEMIRFLRELIKRWRVLVSVPLVAVIATYILTLSLPKVYKTTAQLAAGIVDDTRATLDDSKEQTSSYQVQTKFSNLTELIESRTVFNLVSYKLLFHDLTDKHPFRITNQQLATISQKQKADMVAILDSFMRSAASLDDNDQVQALVRRWLKELGFTLQDIDKATKIERQEASDFISVDAEAESPQLAAFLANTICEQFLKFYVDLRKERNKSMIGFFEKLAKEKKAELDGKVDELRIYKMDKKIINLDEQAKSIVNQISNMELIREGENKKIPSLNRAISDIEQRFSQKEKAFIEAGLTPFNERISILKTKITELNKRLIAVNFKDPEIKDSLASAKKELYEVVKNASDNLLIDPNVPKQELVLKKLNYELELAIAIKSVESTDKELIRLKNMLEEYTPSQAVISSFEREINVIAEAYLVILNKLTYTRFEAENTGESVQVTQHATPPEKAEPSKRLLLIIVAGMASFVLTIVLIILLLYLDLTIKTPKQFIQRSGLDLVGIINKISAEKLDLRVLFGSNSQGQDEAIFQNLLRTFRQHFTEKAPANGVILFTGNHGGEGKTMLMISLAFSLRLTGKKMLLIDTNFKSPDLTRIFNAKPALESVASGEISVEDSISRTSLNNIDVIGCSGLNLTPSEIGGAKTFTEILTEVKAMYDFVFIEGRALLKYSDSKELLQVSDAALLVYEANTTIQEDDINAFLYLKSYEGKFLGAVLNKVHPENMEGLYGEIEKKRSGVRKFIKSIVKRNFTKKKSETMKVSAD